MIAPRLAPAAGGLLLTDRPRRELLHAIEVIAAGGALISRRVRRRLIARATSCA